MAKYLLLVTSNPVEGRDAEYNRWYTEEHLRDVLKLDGFVPPSASASSAR